jgi:hypothetical protein
VNVKKSIIAATLVGIISVLITGCFNANRALKQDISSMSVGDQATMLITKAGGVSKVCEEANQMFYNYGYTNRGAAHFYIFQDSDLTKYPALKALGNVDGIWSGPPDYINIRIGHRPDGYFIEIVNTNNLVTPVIADAGKVEVIKSCVFAHR